MNERPIRIVVAEQGNVPNTVYQIGQPLPEPAGQPQQALTIVDIDEYFEEENEDAEFIILSVGEKDSEYQINGIGMLTRIPSALIVRRDSVVSAVELVEALTEKQARARAEAEAEEAPAEEAEAEPPAQVPQQVPVAYQPAAPVPAVFQVPPEATGQGDPNAPNGGF